MFGSTMLMTVGHALDRAKADGMTVRMHVGGDWIIGRVLDSDGHGVAVLEANGDLCVIRQETITCVRLPGRPGSGHIPTQPTAIERHWND